MANAHVNPNVKAFGMGIIAGMRSMSAPALITHFLSKVPANALQGSPLRFMQSPGVATALKFMASTEIIADKLPGTPNRIAAPVLLVRALSGALVGYTCNQANGESTWAGAILGGTGAVAASYGFYYLRKNLTQSTPIPDAVWAVLEDAIVFAAGSSLAKMPPAHS